MPTDLLPLVALRLQAHSTPSTKKLGSSSHSNKAQSNSLNPLPSTPSHNSSSSNSNLRSQAPHTHAPTPSSPSSRSSSTKAEHGGAMRNGQAASADRLVTKTAKLEHTRSSYDSVGNKVT
eukprot:292160-Pelagomonas_calceolata.AAC.1